MTTAPNAYDEVPYSNLAFPQTHPDRLATVARLFGLSAPDVTRCRVLELGCAGGGNLIPMAFHLPRADFVGIDLSRAHVDTALETVRALNLRNIRIVHGSISDVDEGWGTFDYVICHGVYSWVEPAVQDAILRVARANLADTGLAYVSYNTYPGWHMREMVRDMMRYHAGPFDEPRERIEQARALLDFLASAADPADPYGQLLRLEIKRLSQTTDSYLYHEHLEPTNTPMYFHQFIERAERAGLQFLSEADVSDMLSSAFPPPVAETLERISADILHLEQYMDFVRNRQFRQTVLCHKGRKPKRALDPSVLAGLLLSCRARPEHEAVDLTPMARVVFRAGAQAAELFHPATKTAFMIMDEAWPRAVSVDDLCHSSLDRAAPLLGDVPVDQSRQALLADLFWGAMRGMIRVHTIGPACANGVSAAPRASALAAHQARQGSIVVNARHEMIQLEPLAVAVLPLADGARGPGDIVDALMPLVASGALVVSPAQGPAALGPQGRPALSVEVARTLASLARSALLAD